MVMHLRDTPTTADRRTPSRLGPAAERRLVLAAQRSAGPDRDRLVETFLPLVASVARVYGGSASVDRTELMQEGVVGLLRALERFDPSLETPFWAYAAWWVRQAMQQLMSELTRPVVLSDRAARQLASLNRARHEHLRDAGTTATCDTLSEATGLTRDQIGHLVTASRVPCALDEPIGNGSGGTLTFGDQLPDSGSGDAYDRVEQRLAAERVPELMGCLDEREGTIVRARFGFDGDPKTLREVGVTFGISVERVRQIEQRAIGKLRGLALPVQPV
jgi:RNA polymerase sigma factor (sigma-70 family)